MTNTYQFTLSHWNQKLSTLTFFNIRYNRTVILHHLQYLSNEHFEDLYILMSLKGLTNMDCPMTINNILTKIPSTYHAQYQC